MKIVKRTSIKPENIDEKTLDEIVKLHQQDFAITKQLVIESLKNKSSIDIYRYHHKIVASVGLLWIVSSDAVYFYIGNAMIDKKYRSRGILTRSLIHGMLITFFKYPFKKHISVYFATSETAFRYGQRFVGFWPKPNTTLPPKILAAMILVARNVVDDHYQVFDDKVLVTYLSHQSQDIKQEYVQIVCFMPISVRNAFRLLSVYLRSVKNFLRKKIGK